MQLSDEIMRKIIRGKKTIMVVPHDMCLGNIDFDGHVISFHKMKTIYDCGCLNYFELKADCGEPDLTDELGYQAHCKYWSSLFPNKDRFTEYCMVYSIKVVKKNDFGIKLYEAIKQLNKNKVIVGGLGKFVYERDNVIFQINNNKPTSFDLNLHGWSVVDSMNFSQAIASGKKCIGIFSNSKITFKDGKLENKSFSEAEVNDVWVHY